MNEQTNTPPRCPSCAAAMTARIDGWWHCSHGHETILATPDASRTWTNSSELVLLSGPCPSCGAEMVRIDNLGVQFDQCANCGLVPIASIITSATPSEPPPVPCPACEGRGGRQYDVPCGDNLTDFYLECAICRGSGNVPPALAAAWVAAGQRSGGDGE